jgi:hypothetical protein
MFLMSDELADQRALVEKYAKKLEIDELGSYTKIVLGKEVTAEALTLDECKKLVNAMKAKATRLGIALEGSPRAAGGLSEKQLAFIESLVGQRRISPAMLTGYIQDVNPHASIPQQLSKREASKLIDRLTGLSDGAKKNRDDLL